MTANSPIPRAIRGIVRGYINSEQPQDKARALELCEEYGLDYDTARREIYADMVAYERARLGTKPKPAQGLTGFME